jgi:hypothetical protein
MSEEANLPVVIQTVIQRFPGRPGEIVRYCLEDESFRALCEDYGLAAETLRRLETVERSQVESRIAEYRSLLDDLEREIARELTRLAGHIP